MSRTPTRAQLDRRALIIGSMSSRRFVEQSVVTSLVPLLKRNLAKQPPPRHDAPFVVRWRASNRAETVQNFPN